MDLKISFTTDRLSLSPLSEKDSKFILELVNTEGWLTFIGNKNINTETDAIVYIQKISTNINVSYWVVSLQHTNEQIGIITFIKRDYLDYHDIGFAFLPRFHGMGFGFEATQKVLNFLKENHTVTIILATTIPENINSIQLLKKLGLSFNKEINVNEELLHVYSSSI